MCYYELQCWRDLPANQNSTLVTKCHRIVELLWSTSPTNLRGNLLLESSSNSCCIQWLGLHSRWPDVPPSNFYVRRWRAHAPVSLLPTPSSPPLHIRGWAATSSASAATSSPLVLPGECSKMILAYSVLLTNLLWMEYIFVLSLPILTNYPNLPSHICLFRIYTVLIIFLSPIF